MLTRTDATARPVGTRRWGVCGVCGRVLAVLLACLVLGPLAPAGAEPAGGPHGTSTSGTDADLQVSRPIHIELKGPFIRRKQADGSYVSTFTDGIYIHFRTSEPDAFVELRAQNAVVFSEPRVLSEAGLGEQVSDGPRQGPERQASSGRQDMSGVFGRITGTYLEGDVVLQVDRYGFASDYVITADRLYYDFAEDRALCVDCAMQLRLDDPGVNIYMRAERIRQLSASRFSAECIRLSNDEFYVPHVCLAASKAQIEVDRRVESDSQDEPQLGYTLNNVTMNLSGMPVFWWPRAQGTWSDADAPLKNIHTSYESDRGVSFESEWHLAWLLGLREPNGVESTLHLDEFSKRGAAGGVDIDYTSEQYFGNLRGYLLGDKGQDDLGNYEARRGVDPPESIRGRGRWQHRHYLPLDWQGTFEISYRSDPDFLESWYEKEFDTDKEQETLVYFKQQRDNWSVDLLNKWHLNDFDYTVTELPKLGFHIAGQDLFETLTYYHDGYVSRIRERAGFRSVPGFSGAYEPSLLEPMLDEKDFAFAVSRHELVWPLHLQGLHFSPVAIGTYAYDDSADDRSLVQGAIGLRSSTQLWHVDNSVKSDLWDLDRMRHVIVPEVSAFWTDSDRGVIEHHNVLNLALRQRWQTLRGPEDDKQSVDFLRWDCSLTLTDRDVDDADLPSAFFFTKPEKQLDFASLTNPDFVNLGLAGREHINQTFSDHVTTDVSWLISDTTTLTGSCNYNIHDGVVSLADAAIAVQRSPRTTYYFGDRYFRDGDPFGDDGIDDVRDSHFLTAGATYKLNRKYTFAAAHQFDIDRGDGAYTQAVIIRKFVRWYGAFSIGYDAAQSSVAFQVGFWPEGFDKVAVGTRRFARLTR